MCVIRSAEMITNICKDWEGDGACLLQVSAHVFLGTQQNLPGFLQVSQKTASGFRCRHTDGRTDGHCTARQVFRANGN
jgi:hypothetical protein